MPKAKKTGRCFPQWDEHQGYRDTGKTWTETVGDRVVTWKIFKCQCGKRTTDISKK